jgi:hypothetical protein
VSTVALTYRYVGDLFDGTVRTRGLVLAQPEATQARIRAALDRLTAEYATDGGFDLPISIKLASATAK